MSLRDVWRKLNIRGRGVFIYLCISLVPTVILGFVFFSRLDQDLRSEFQNVQQGTLELACQTFEGEARRVENISEMLQSNQSVLEFISGDQISVGDEVYNFLQYVQPALAYIRLNNTMVLNIRIYNNSRYEVRTNNPVASLADAPAEIQQLEQTLNMEKCCWRMTRGENGFVFKLYKNLYNARRSRKCGLLELTLSPKILTAAFGELAEHSDLMLLAIDGERYRVTGEGIAPLDEPLPNGLASRVPLSSLDAEIEVITCKYARQSRQIQVYSLEMIALLTLTTAQFIVFNLAFERRLRRFANHMTKQGDSLVEYGEPVGSDEIARMIRSYNSRIRHIRDLVEKEYLMAIRNKEIEYYALQAQIKPHFIFNTLENIRMNALCSGDMTTSEMLCALGEFIRYNCRVMKNATLAQEMENVRQYMTILSLRMGDEMTFREKIELPIDRIICPQFILQPLVENAVEHGFHGRAGKKIIRVHIYRANGCVEIDVCDNGVGIDPKTLEQLNGELGRLDTRFRLADSENRGIGLNNVSQRVKLAFGASYGLQLQSAQGRYTVCRLILKD